VAGGWGHEALGGGGVHWGANSGAMTWGGTENSCQLLGFREAAECRGGNVRLCAVGASTEVLTVGP
jgi:hypothetical protein